LVKEWRCSIYPFVPSAKEEFVRGFPQFLLITASIFTAENGESAELEKRFIISALSAVKKIYNSALMFKELP